MSKIESSAVSGPETDEACIACFGRGRVDRDCDDPQCGDSTWDHACTMGSDPCEHCAGSGKSPLVSQLRASVREREADLESFRALALEHERRIRDLESALDEATANLKSWTDADNAMKAEEADAALKRELEAALAAEKPTKKYCGGCGITFGTVQRFNEHACSDEIG